MGNDLDNFIPLMERRGVTISTEEFHKAVNTIFHDVESKYYDKIHHDLDTSAQDQFDLIGDDILKVLPKDKPIQLTLLDVGCGTGLSTEKLLRSSIGKYISKVYLLDTSAGMLEQCKLKASKWNIPYEFINSDVYSVSSMKFDIILTCSVLHHIPNLPDFFDKITSLQSDHGFFVHLMDPNGDFLFTDAYLKRKEELSDYVVKERKRIKMEKLKHDLPGIIIRKIKLKVFGIKPKNSIDYIGEVNEELMKAGVIKTALTPGEIWSVTDLHVEDLTDYGKGISFEFLKKELTAYKCVSQRSYAFFGPLKTHLPQHYQVIEERWANENRLDGRMLLGIWQLK